MTHRNRATFAGRWYSDDQNALREEISDALRQARTAPSPLPPSASPSGRITGAVLPHAGLFYSGRGIAHAFAHPEQLTGIERVVILSPGHYEPLESGSLYVESFDRHETPLGDLAGEPLFSGRLREILGNAVVKADKTIEAEHGTEMFLPFLRSALPAARVSLVLVPTPRVSGATPDEFLTDTDRFARAIRDALAADDPAGLANTLVIMSSDFTHYGPRFGYTPFGVPGRPPARSRGDGSRRARSDGAQTAPTADEIAATVRDDDVSVARAIAAGDRTALLERMRSPITVSGRAAILLGSAILGSPTGSVTDYYTSRDVTGRSEAEFVCYASILFGDTDGT
ncbi:MAG: AmmeMemoRadiSam system protein B [Spirochaeta sp.]|jgi:AmmeMemoRadiSam system protein B|nr:AmmeMemoRadiSam system protein B [Spirochaeta sp.]